AIISHHMTSIAPNGGSAIAGIASSPAMPPPLSRKHPGSATSTAIPTATIRRSWRSTRLGRSGVDVTVRREVQVRELRIFLADVDLHGPAERPARLVADLRALIFEP